MPPPARAKQRHDCQRFVSGSKTVRADSLLGDCRNCSPRSSPNTGRKARVPFSINPRLRKEDTRRLRCTGGIHFLPRTPSDFSHSSVRCGQVLMLKGVRRRPYPWPPIG